VTRSDRASRLATATAIHLPGFEPEPAAPDARRRTRPPAGQLPPGAAGGESGRLPPGAAGGESGRLPPGAAGGESGRLPFTVIVTRSRKRRRSVGAQLVGGTLRLAIPSWMSKAEEAHWIDEMSRRFMRKMSTDRFHLGRRAAGLAKRLDLPAPTDIRWATDMTARWGSCTPELGTIRISDRLAAFPDWVVDYVIVHELAHLVVLNHDDDFWRLVHRFEMSERAIGYLIAKSADGD
jgi:hypothetical protein